MKYFKQALILCGGKATRLRPCSYSHSKAELPFLNLPILAYPWKLAEDLKNNSFLLNSHLFPEEFKKTAGELCRKDQKMQAFFEKEPLSSTGTLYHLKKELKKSPYFTYINGDCLLFPSSSQKLFEFEQEFLKSKAEALLFVIPLKYNSKNSSLNQSTSNDRRLFFKFWEGLLDSCKKSNSHRNDEGGKSGRDKQSNNSNESRRDEEERGNRQKRFLYCDSQQNLKEIRLPQSTDKQAYFFTGLALFKSSLLDELKGTEKDLFSDFLQPLLAHKKIKVFIDKDAFFLEAGDKESYLKSTEFCLKSLLTSSFLLSPSSSDHLLSSLQKSPFNQRRLSRGMESKLSSLRESPFNQSPMTQEQAFFQEQTKFVRKRLQDTFKRFDPKDEKVGLKNGSIWSQKLKAFLLAPYSVRGLDLLKVEGFSVIAPKVGFYNKTKVKNSVLTCPHFSLQGSLEEDLILTRSHV